MTILITGCARLGMDALAMALQSFGFEVVAASSARDVSAQAAIEAVLLGANGIVPRVLANIHGCRVRFPGAPIVLMGDDHTEQEIMTFIQSGARAYTPPDTPLEELVSVLKAVRAGEAPCSGRLAALVSSRIAALARAQREAMIAAGLTAREQQVLRLIRSGLSNKEIGQQLSISSNTVKIHVHRILQKLRIRRRHEARRWDGGGSTPA